MVQGSVSPYNLTDKDIEPLESVGLYNNYELLTFVAPAGTKAMRFHLYQLNKNNNWEIKFYGGLLTEPSESDKNPPIEGTFSMVRHDDYSLSFYISSAGSAVYKAEPFNITPTNMAYSGSFLPDKNEAKLNQEIPVSLMVYDSGTSSLNYTLADFFTPEKFADKDIVQAVTLTFYDHEPT